MKWEEKGRRERKKREETKRDRQGCEDNFHSLRVPDQCARVLGLVERAHPASSAAITLRFPTATFEIVPQSRVKVKR